MACYSIIFYIFDFDSNMRLQTQNIRAHFVPWAVRRAQFPWVTGVLFLCNVSILTALSLATQEVITAFVIVKLLIWYGIITTWSKGVRWTIFNLWLARLVGSSLSVTVIKACEIPIKVSIDIRSANYDTVTINSNDITHAGGIFDQIFNHEVQAVRVAWYSQLVRLVLNLLLLTDHWCIVPSIKAVQQMHWYQWRRHKYRKYPRSIRWW